MNISQALEFAKKLKQKKNSVDILSISEIRCLLAIACKKSVDFVFMNIEYELSEFEIASFESYLHRRLNFEPIAYIAGVKEFYGRDFKLNNACLIPRPDTETLIDSVLEYIKAIKLNSTSMKILDIATGSGCIGITLAKELDDHVELTLADISTKALNVAALNIEAHAVQNVKIIESNWFEAFDQNEIFDIICSNPPYICISEQDVMSKETLLYEPKTALFAEENGFLPYKIIANQAKNFLSKNGAIFLEVGYNMSESVKKIFLEESWSFHGSKKDLLGYERCLIFNVK